MQDICVTMRTRDQPSSELKKEPRRTLSRRLEFTELVGVEKFLGVQFGDLQPDRF